MSPAARERRFSRIREIGCLACRKRGWYSSPDVHHLNLGAHAGQKRRGDEATIGLCPYHHRSVTVLPMGLAYRSLGPSLAREPNEFRRTFGTDDELLAEQNQLIEEYESMASVKGVA